MGMVIIDQRGSRLSHQSGALMIRIADARPRSVPLRLLDRLVIAASVQIESSLLTHLAEHQIGLLILPARGHRRSACLHNEGHGDAARRLGQYRLVLDPELSLFWARHFVLARINGSRRLLQRAMDQRPDRRRALHHGVDKLARMQTRARTTATHSQLRGIEGAGAAAHFAAYRSLFAPSLQFRRRNRRPPRDPVNAALSLGYTLAHQDAVQTLLHVGLDPMLGVLHEPLHSRESLACDLVEIARPGLEQWIWRLFAERRLKAEHFGIENEAARMRKPARQVFFAAYQSNAGRHRRVFERYARRLARVCADIEARKTS